MKERAYPIEPLLVDPERFGHFMEKAVELISIPWTYAILQDWPDF